MSFYNSAFRLVLSSVGWARLPCISFCALPIFATLYCISSVDFYVITSLLSFGIHILLCLFILVFKFLFPSDHLVFTPLFPVSSISTSFWVKSNFFLFSYLMWFFLKFLFWLSIVLWLTFLNQYSALLILADFLG